MKSYTKLAMLVEFK